MSEFSENKELEQTEIINTAEESTIFSAPTEHKDQKARNGGKKRRLVAIISAFLAVAVLVGGTVAVIQLIPELEEGKAENSVFKDISVVECDTKAFSNVTITNQKGTFKLVPQTVGEGDSAKKYWTVEGTDVSKLSSSLTENIISDAADITALREIKTLSDETCGLNNPKIKVEVGSDTKEPYTVLIGNESPDGLGSYLKIEGTDIIYVVSSDEFASFDFELIDLADVTSIPITSFAADSSSYKDDSGINKFDALTLSGKQFPDAVTIHKNQDESDSGALVSYIVKTPLERYGGDNIATVLQLFSSEIAVAGAYSFEINDQTLKQVGLDNPDMVVALTIQGETKTFKISKVSNDYCAVIYDGATMIRKVKTSSISCINYTADDLYSTWITMYSINDLANLTGEVDGQKYSFDIDYSENGETSEEKYTVTKDGNQIKTSYFQGFYQIYVSLGCTDFTVDDIKSDPVATFTHTFHDGSKSVLKFYKANATQYQYSINDVHMGKVTSAGYDKIIKNMKTVAENKQPAEQ